VITIKQGLIGNDGTEKLIEPGLEKNGEDAVKMLSLKMEKCVPPFVPQATSAYPTRLALVRNGHPGERTFIATFEGEAEEMRPLFRQAVVCLLRETNEMVIRRVLVIGVLEPDASERLVARMASARSPAPLSDDVFLTLIERKLEQPHLRFADLVEEMDRNPDSTAR